MNVLDVGKYKGKDFEYVERNDPGYARWVLSLESPTNRSLLEFSNYLRNKGQKGSAPLGSRKEQTDGKDNGNGFVSIGNKGSVAVCGSRLGSSVSYYEINKDGIPNLVFDCKAEDGMNINSDGSNNKTIGGQISVISGVKTEGAPGFGGACKDLQRDLAENSNNVNMSHTNKDMGEVKLDFMIKECEKELKDLISETAIVANGLNAVFKERKAKLDCGIIFSLVSPTMFRISSEKNNKSSMSLPKVLGDYLKDYKMSENCTSKKIRLFHTGMHGIDSKPYSSWFIFPGVYYDRLLNIIQDKFECELSPIPDFVLDKFPEFKNCEIEDIDGDCEKVQSLTPKYNPNTIDLPDCGICDGCVFESTCYESLSHLKINYPDLFNSLRPFQRVGVLSGLRKKGRILIGDEMGLGKTLQALSIITYFKKEWPALIICPSSIRFQWYQQALDWLSPSINKSNINLVRSSNDEYSRRCSIVIISYDLITRNEHFRSYFGDNFKVVIADESHFLKNSTAKRTQIIVPILHGAKRVVLLSGTPALNNPTELYEQINAIVRPSPELYNKKSTGQSKSKKINKDKQSGRLEFNCGSRESNDLTINKRRGRLVKPTVLQEKNGGNDVLITSPNFPSYLDFARRYSDMRINKFSHKKEFYGSRNTEELHLFIRKSAMIRRLKKQVLSELPPKQRSRIPLEIKDKSGLKKIKELLSDSNMQLQSTELDDNDSKISSLHKLTCEIKILPVQEYIEYLLDSSDDKYVIFAHHHIMLDAIESVLLRRKKNSYYHSNTDSKSFLFIRIDGKTSGSKREEYVKEFQTNGDCKVALLSITACGQGLNLTSAGTVIFAELYWVPGTMLQAEDRCHRIGTLYSSINIHYLIAEDTLDDKMWGTLCRKQKIMASTLDGIDKRKNDIQHFIVHDK